jgi:hypothetical protein
VNVVNLEAFRARRCATVPPATLTAAPGRVLLDLGDGTGLELSPERARAWAARLAAMADVAAALAEEGGPHAL